MILVSHTLLVLVSCPPFIPGVTLCLTSFEFWPAVKPYAKSATGCSRNHSWQTVLDVFLTLFCQVSNAGHGGRNLVCLGTGKPGSHRPGWASRVRQGAMLTTGLVQTLLGHQLSSRWTPVHKPSSNSGLPIAWITAPAMGASLTKLPYWNCQLKQTFTL